jgi:hypothetical protein
MIINHHQSSSISINDHQSASTSLIEQQKALSSINLYSILKSQSEN